MSSSNGNRRRGRVPYIHGKSSAPIDHDKFGTYTERQLRRMDEKFIRAVERAFANGSERRQSAGDANASRLR